MCRIPAALACLVVLSAVGRRITILSEPLASRRAEKMAWQTKIFDFILEPPLLADVAQLQPSPVFRARKLNPWKALRLLLLGMQRICNLDAFQLSTSGDSRIGSSLLSIARASSQVPASVPVLQANSSLEFELPHNMRPLVDLTPAADKFATLPDSEFDHDVSQQASAFSSLRARFSVPKAHLMKDSNPFSLVREDMQKLKDRAQEMMQDPHPVMMMAAKKFKRYRDISRSNKQDSKFRACIVALVWRALSNATDGGDSDERLPEHQLKLAAIAELMHVALWFQIEVPRHEIGEDAEDVAKKIKGAILASDNLLAAAAQTLASLQDSRVQEIMAHALNSMTAGYGHSSDMRHYLRQCYFKSAALLSSSCKSAAILHGHAEKHDVTESLEAFGYHLGMASQIIDDIVDFKHASSADLRFRLSTAPFLYASESKHELHQLIKSVSLANADGKAISLDDEVGKAVSLAKDTDCLDRSYRLAEFHAEKGLEALARLPQNEGRDALAAVMDQVLARAS